MSIQHHLQGGSANHMPRHPSFFGDSTRVHYFAPLPTHFEGPFVAISPINGRMADLSSLWNLLTMDLEFGDATVVFTGNYLSGDNAKELMSLMCSLRLSHPSPIFLAGPTDLAAAAFLGLLKNLELSAALLAVGTAWAETHQEVFRSYGVDGRSAVALLHAMPPEHREFLTELAVSVQHPDLILTAMPATQLTHSSLTSSFASDFFSLPHPLGDSTSLHHAPHPSSPAAAHGSHAADLDGMHISNTSKKQNAEKTLYVDPLAEFPGRNADGAAVNGEGRLSALFFPSGRVVVAPTS